MTSRTHDVFAFAGLITAAAFFPPQSLNLTTLIVAIVAADIGGLMPDLDQAGNRLWHLLPAGEKVGGVLRRVFYKHRTFSHSLVGMYCIYRVLEWGLPQILNENLINEQIVLWSVMVGYISHFVADSLTEDGLPLLFPINITFGIPPIRSIRIKTGQWFENLIVYPSVWIYIIWFMHYKRDVLIQIFQSIRS